MPRKTYTDQDIIEKSQQVKSLGSLLQSLGLKVAGGNYIHMKKQLQRLNIDTSHWTGQAWSKDQQLKNYTTYKRVSSIRRWLLKERGHQCENCLNTKWLGQMITLEIDHINGDRTNNTIENLKLLCPNCHSQTITWRGRKNNKVK